MTSDGKPALVGHTSEFSSANTNSLAAIAGYAIRLRAMYADFGLALRRSPSLTALIEDTELLGDPGVEGCTFPQLFSALQIQRIADAVLPLASEPNIRHKAAETLDGDINLLGRNRSKAKDTLWELELRRVLSKWGIETAFAEPDLIVTLAGAGVGVACKKLYSEANVEKVLSQAVRQIERNCSAGIVALDIGDLMPAGAILQVRSVAGMDAGLNAHNDGFMLRHERHLRKYLEPARAISVVVSCSSLVDIADHEPQFFTARQTTMWTIPSPQSATHSDQVRAILQALLSSHRT
jgi:hypothetical protein